MATPYTPAKTIKDEFSPDFQKDILALLYLDPNFLRLSSETIKPEHFDDKVDATYAEIFISFVKKFPKDSITKEVVFHEISKRIKTKRIVEDERTEYVKTFVRIATTPKALEYVKTEIRRFVLAKSLEVELVGSVDLLRKGQYKEIIDRMTAAYTKVESTEKRVDIKVVGSVGDRVALLKDPEASLTRAGISTGLPELDAKLYRKGIGKGEMLVICGSPGRGKSIWLANLTMAAVLQGNNVLYYTLEMASDIVMNRFDAMVTGIPFVDLIKHADLVAERWGIIQRSFKFGEIFLHDLPPRYLTPNMIRRHIRSYEEEGIRIDALVVDYADIMASDRRIDERRLEHGDVYEQLRAIGKECSVDVMTASQANRDSLRKKDIDIDSMAEDFSKAMTADYVIGLSQTKSEEAYCSDGCTGIMRAFLAKNRNGPKNINVEFYTDFTRMRISKPMMDEFDRTHFGRLIT